MTTEHGHHRIEYTVDDETLRAIHAEMTPASRQPLVEASTMVPTSLDDEVELDSPGFVSRELAAFSARGFQRRNR